MNFSRKTAFLCLLGFLLILPCSDVSAVKDPKAKYNKIQKEIKKKRDALAKSKTRAISILKELESTNKKLLSLKKDVKGLKKKINKTKREISSLKGEIGKLSKKIDTQRSWLKRKIQALQKYGTFSFFAFDRTNIRQGKGISPGIGKVDPIMSLLTAEDLSHMIRIWRYLRVIAEYEYNLLKDYSKNLKELRLREAKLSGLLKRFEQGKKQVLSKETRLRQQKRKKRLMLSSIREEQGRYKMMLSELKESSRRLRKIIEESEKAAYIQEGFSKMKRRLPWPVNGMIALPYGSYLDPQFKTPVFRNGIHFRSKEGEVVKVIFPGKVVFAEWFKGYGRVVIVNHGEGYHTVYANLNDIFLKKGDIIKRGGSIGIVGESGTLSAPGLYFEVRYKGKPLNPLHWLVSKTSKRKKG
jgi:septal ring factor EnvC (AmiA/AmiB activator)